VKSRISKLPAKHIKPVQKELDRIALLIQTKREQAGLTQEVLAEKLDVSPMTIQFVEQGRRTPSLQLLIALAKELNFTLKIG
jgi:putative transcriptional regulator